MTSTRPTARQRLNFARRREVPGRNELIASLYRAGASSTELGRRFGMTNTNVLHLLRRLGVPVRSREEGKAAARRVLVAAAAIRRFGHQLAPASAAPPPAAELPPVNELFEDGDLPDFSWGDAW